MATPSGQAPTKYGIALFPGFQALDVFGPVDILNLLSKSAELKIAVLAATLDPVSTSLTEGGFGQSLLPTHTYDDAPSDIEVLLVPGGLGTRDDAITTPVVEYLQKAYPKLRYLLTVCTGSALVAKSGVIDGKRATSNKRAWKWVRKIHNLQVLLRLTFPQGNHSRPKRELGARGAVGY